MGEILKRGL